MPTASPSLSSSGAALVARRLHAVGLSAEIPVPFREPTDVVRWFGALQSQDYGPAKWSIGQRLPAAADSATESATDGTLDRLFDEGAILRTHVLRPTWHFVVPEDIRWLLELTGPRVHTTNGFMYRQEGLDDDVRRTSEAVLVDALRGGNHLTRAELAAVLAKAGIVAERFRLAYVLMSAELNGVVCSGPLRGKQHTYALLEERVPDATRLSREEALAELTLRYFRSHGPATVKDFGWWSSLTRSDITRGLDLVGSRLAAEVVDGVTYWFSAESADLTVPPPAVHLLQGYDEYVVGYSESKRLLDVAGRARSIADRAVFNGILVVAGQVGGHWKRTVSWDRVVIEVALYEPLDAAHIRALHAAGDRHGMFLGRSATVVTTQL